MMLRKILKRLQQHAFKLAITGEQSFSLQISTNQNPREHGWNSIEAVSVCRIAAIEQLLRYIKDWDQQLLLIQRKQSSAHNFYYQLCSKNGVLLL